MKHRIRRKNARLRSGQAIVEMAVCLVAVLAVLGGFLLISGLGLENVRNAIRSREAVDQKARDGITSASGRMIRTWSYGSDGIPFTRDDKVSEWTPDVNIFLTELKDETEPLDLKDSAVFPHLAASNNFAETLSPARLFLAAAGLAMAKITENDPLEKRNLSSFRSLIKALIANPDFSLEDSAFIPSGAASAE